MDHGVTQAERDTNRRSLVQPPVQSRVSCETRRGCFVHSGISKDGNCTISVGKLLQCLLGLMARGVGGTNKQLYLYLVGSVPVSAYACCLTSSHHSMRRACLHLLINLHVGMGMLLLGHSKFSLPQPD